MLMRSVWFDSSWPFTVSSWARPIVDWRTPEEGLEPAACVGSLREEQSEKWYQADYFSCCKTSNSRAGFVLSWPFTEWFISNIYMLLTRPNRLGQEFFKNRSWKNLGFQKYKSFKNFFAGTSLVSGSFSEQELERELGAREDLGEDSSLSNSWVFANWGKVCSSFCNNVEWVWGCVGVCCALIKWNISYSYLFWLIFHLLKYRKY